MATWHYMRTQTPLHRFYNSVAWHILITISFETREVLNGRSWPSKIKNSFFFLSIFFLNFYFIYLFMYFFVYTPSNQHFEAFLVSKFNSETSFLYQLFKENLNFIVTEPWKVTGKSIFYDFHYYLYLFESLFMHLYTFISTF